jgi:hypothetical protein
MLYQNEPNPFKSTTVIKFYTPEAGSAKVTILDITGKQLVTRTVEAVKGINRIELNRRDLPVTGLVYYQVESGSAKGVKTMILVD